MAVTKHGMAKTPLYKAWENMRQRVTNARVYPTYVNVGCDERWLTFQGFLDNQPAGRPFEPGLCLSRFGDEGDYSPENTRWLTRSENCREQKRPAPKTHCNKGHEYTPENTKPCGDYHTCRICAVERTRQWRAKKAA
jgi:hypothetical protein